MDKKIEVYGVAPLGRKPITLDIPRTAETLGIPEFFKLGFSSYDNFHPPKFPRISREGENTSVHFKLEDLAGAFFGFYRPEDFIDMLSPHLEEYSEGSYQLRNAITRFEKNNKTAHINAGYYFNGNWQSCNFWEVYNGANTEKGELKDIFSKLPKKYESNIRRNGWIGRHILGGNDKFGAFSLKSINGLYKFLKPTGITFYLISEDEFERLSNIRKLEPFTLINYLDVNTEGLKATGDWSEKIANLSVDFKWLIKKFWTRRTGKEF